MFMTDGWTMDRWMTDFNDNRDMPFYHSLIENYAISIIEDTMVELADLHNNINLCVIIFDISKTYTE